MPLHEYYSINEAAEELGLTPRIIDHMINKKRVISPAKIGRRWVITRTQLMTLYRYHSKAKSIEVEKQINRRKRSKKMEESLGDYTKGHHGKKRVL